MAFNKRKVRIYHDLPQIRCTEGVEPLEEDEEEEEEEQKKDWLCSCVGLSSSSAFPQLDCPN